MAEERLHRPERARTTPDLLKHALAEAKLLARAEVAVARAEMRAELNRAIRAAMALGAAAVLALCGLAVLFVTIALALPMADWAAALIVGLVLLAVAAIAGLVGKNRLPTKPMQRTKARLLDDVALTREQLQ